VPVSRAQRTAIADRRTKLLQMRLAGVDFTTIADRLDYSSPAAARKDFTRTMRETLDLEQETANELREVELQRLDRLQAAAWAEAARGELKAIETVLRVIDRRCRILGLYAAVQVDATITEVTQQDLELQDILNSARARNAARMAGLPGTTPE
jgi:hypothetical protein